MSVRVRFAPSPTGTLHVGGARTALFNFLFAKKHKGQFIIRIEDTDLQRNDEKFIWEQLKTLKWLGLVWDEGPESEGSHGPYRQSQRQDIYKKYAEQLIKEGQAYYCFLTDDEISRIKSKTHSHQIQSPYRSWSLEKALEKKKEGCPAVVRFKMPDVKKTYELDDMVRGKISFPSDMVGDFILLRSTGMPVYNFCCAIDDSLMKITHILRAEEHLANTLRQMAVMSALQFPSPRFGHLSLILDSHKKKLSKRSGALSCMEYKEQGILPASMNNFLALLGWNPKDNQEIFNLEELIENFCETKLNPAGAVFDENKLKWINARHIRLLPFDELWNLLQPDFNKNGLIFSEDPKWKERAVESLKPSFSNMKEAFEIFRLVSKNYYEIDESAQIIKTWEHSKKVLEKWQFLIEQKNQPCLSLEDFELIKNQIKEECGVKGKFLFMPLRIAMIGRLHGLELNIAVTLLECSTLIERAKKALNHIF